jgi:hypothetical protein
VLIRIDVYCIGVLDRGASLIYEDTNLFLGVIDT